MQEYDFVHPRFLPIAAWLKRNPFPTSNSCRLLLRPAPELVTLASRIVSR